MGPMKNLTVLSMLLVAAGLVGRPVSAQEPDGQSRPFRIGHFIVSVPQSWTPLSDADKTGARAEFASDLAPGMTQYERAGDPAPRLGQFEIFQKPTDAQLLGWTIVIPEQTDFLKEILKREDVQFEKGKSLSGGRIKGGSCSLIKVSGLEVVRIDVEMANGAKSTNLHFWSPKHPGIISTLMFGIRPQAIAPTAREYEAMLATLTVSEEVKD